MLNIKRIGEGVTRIVFSNVYLENEVVKVCYEVGQLLSKNFEVVKVEYRSFDEDDDRYEVHAIIEGQWTHDGWIELGDYEFFITCCKGIGE